MFTRSIKDIVFVGKNGVKYQEDADHQQHVVDYKIDTITKETDPRKVLDLAKGIDTTSYSSMSKENKDILMAASDRIMSLTQDFDLRELNSFERQSFDQLRSLYIQNKELRMKNPTKRKLEELKLNITASEKSNEKV